MTDLPASEARPVLHISRLVEAAAKASSVLWVQAPGEPAYAVWFAWHDDGDPRSVGASIYVVSGPGEQILPPLPDEVIVHFRSKDDGGRLLSLRSSTLVIEPDDDGWAEIAEALRAGRLNAAPDVLGHWREHCVIHAITPFGRPLAGPGQYRPDAAAEPVRVADGTTATWRPWHLRGRARARRNR